MYSYNYFDMMGTAIDEGGLIVLGILLSVAVIMLIIAAVIYVFKSIGLYTIAKRRGINNPWLAWVPIGQEWILGSIADQYQYVSKGKIKNKRKIMLFLSLSIIAVNVIMRVASAVMLFLATPYTSSAVMLSTMVTILFSLVNFALALALLVFCCLALYELYSSCCPENNVLFLVLGIIFTIAVPFFIFFSRKKDGGMPPRRPEYVDAQ